ncbi:Axonemal 84 kDa protein [Operophtera brumata]|uniref:Axonemal 84 kDa protein n=1 Tax=Operophtera brumata TaxID=104452 RepID=A0A0L7LE79_OPEBR|nr:Axonemal 84 kDa protein [Operophtera brumata]
MIKDNVEQDIRLDLLQKTCTLFHKYETQKKDFENKKQLQAEMNTYLHLWELETKTDDNELDKRCSEALPIASYTLLRDLEKYLKWESVKLAIYQREFKGLRLNIWVAIKLPTRLRKPVEPEQEPVELAFPAMKVALKLPKSIDGSCVCVRAARSMIDLLSESSRSFALKDLWRGTKFGSSDDSTSAKEDERRSNLDDIKFIKTLVAMSMKVLGVHDSRELTNISFEPTMVPIYGHATRCRMPQHVACHKVPHATICSMPQGAACHNM